MSNLIATEYQGFEGKIGFPDVRKTKTIKEKPNA